MSSIDRRGAKALRSASLLIVALSSQLASAQEIGDSGRERADALAFAVGTLAESGANGGRLRALEAQARDWRGLASERDWIAATEAVHTAAMQSNVTSTVTIAASRASHCFVGSAEPRRAS